MTHILPIVMAAALTACANLAQAAAVSTRSAPEASCSQGGKRTVVGYFDHTAAWYRQRPRFQTNQALPHVWKAGNPDALVVLYNDISAPAAGEGTEESNLQAVGKQIEARSADIAEYLEAANRNGRVKVLLEVPRVPARRLADDPTSRELMQQFISRWSRYRALAGFYIFDEPELKRIPVRTLQEVASLVKQHAPDGRNTVALSVAHAGGRELKPLIRDYASASPRAFDVMLVNRYPVYRKYARLGTARSGAMSAKLGLTDDKAGRENLADNEFANLDDYYESLMAATALPNLAGRPVYVSMQAYGLRDDCDGPGCKAIKEHSPRRSPTWNELLYLFTSAWMSGADGAIFYSHYLSLYDKALRARLNNLEELIARVYAYLPDCESVAIEPKGNEGVIARYAGGPDAGKPEYLVIMHGMQGRTSLRIPLTGHRPTEVEELRFDAQGNSSGSARRTATGAAGGRHELRLNMQGYGVTIFQLRYQ